MLKEAWNDFLELAAQMWPGILMALVLAAWSLF